MEPLTHFFADKTIGHILDVGTGKGNFIEVLKYTFPDANITGVDPDENSLAEARINYSDSTFLRMQAEKMVFQNDTFDLASISMALHHLRKINRGLLEMKRVVKPGGWFIINELISDNLNSAQEVHKLYHHFRSQIDRLTGICHRETFTRNAILHMLKVADITVQFFFEDISEVNLAAKPEEVDERSGKMEQALERIRGRKEYDDLKPMIAEFRDRAVKYGFQPATNLVIVGRKK